MDINSVRFSRDWLSRTQTVLRNAYTLCGMCHLQIFKAFDSKIKEHTFPHLDSELGLRHVMAQEFFSADKKTWNTLAQLYSKGTWSLDDLYGQKTTWMDYHPSFLNNFFKYKNLKRSIDDPPSYVLLFSNKVASLDKNSQSTHWPGAKHSTSSSYHNALATSLLHLPASGDAIGIRLGLLLQLLPTESNLWQPNVTILLIKTSEANGYQMDLTSAHLQQSTLPS